MSIEKRDAVAGDYSWLRALGKGVRDAAVSGVMLGLYALAASVFGALEPEDLAKYGVPALFLPAFTGVFAMIRNVLRVRFNWPLV